MLITSLIEHKHQNGPIFFFLQLQTFPNWLMPVYWLYYQRSKSDVIKDNDKVPTTPTTMISKTVFGLYFNCIAYISWQFTEFIVIYVGSKVKMYTNIVCIYLKNILKIIFNTIFDYEICIYQIRYISWITCLTGGNIPTMTVYSHAVLIQGHKGRTHWWLYQGLSGRHRDILRQTWLISSRMMSCRRQEQ